MCGPCIGTYWPPFLCYLPVWRYVSCKCLLVFESRGLPSRAKERVAEMSCGFLFLTALSRGKCDGISIKWHLSELNVIFPEWLSHSKKKCNLKMMIVTLGKKEKLTKLAVNTRISFKWYFLIIKCCFKDVCLVVLGIGHGCKTSTESSQARHTKRKTTWPTR